MFAQTSRFLFALWTVYAVCAMSAAAENKVVFQYDHDDTMTQFAVEELTRVLDKNGWSVAEDNGDFQIAFERFAPGMGPQSFRIQKEAQRGIRVFGGDSLGMMYGGLELAEQIDLGGGIEAVREIARKPHVLRRGLKFNIPFDGRTPSYDDTGTAAQENIAVMWEFDFWERFLKTMARNRYNVLSLWTTNPYAGIVRLPKYPGVNFDDVGRLTGEITNRTGNHFQDYDLFDPAHHKIIKKITLDDKIAYWTRVFDLAESLGIEIYMFHWNIFIWNADGKHGIDYDQDNPKTIAYVRYCVERFLQTYPQIDGIGVSAGENVNRGKKWKIGIEDWLYQTYGLGVLDTLKADPDRRIRFIFRHLWSDLDKSAAAFEGYDIPFNTSHKYARARLYSTTTSPYLDFEYREKLERTGVPCWLNFRNDDVYVLRWGDPEHAREFLQNLPLDVMKYEAGFYMGPDSYVWGREFIAKDSDLAGQLEIDKHWYRFMMWGRLGYDVTLTRDYFERRLARRHPDLNPTTLYDAWAAASRVFPQIDQFFFRVNDFQFAPEGCMSSSGFLTVDESFFTYPPLRGSGILSVQEYADTVIKGQPFKGRTPFDVADRLDQVAQKALGGAMILRAKADLPKESLSLLADIEALAYMGRYYADKIRGAADLAVYPADKSRVENHRQAVSHLKNAVDEWRRYAEIAGGQYKPQLLSRSYYLDWEALLKEVEKEVETIRAEGPASQ